MDKKWACITGASSGIGRATAFRLAKHYNLILLARRAERLRQIKDEIQQQDKTQILDLACDLRNYRQVDELFNLHKNAFSRVAVLVNNAGLAKGASPFQQSEF